MRNEFKEEPENSVRSQPFARNGIHTLLHDVTKEWYVIRWYDAISSVADNLFVIADGYINQVWSREGLVRHGYLRSEE